MYIQGVSAQRFQTFGRDIVYLDDKKSHSKAWSEMLS